MLLEKSFCHSWRAEKGPGCAPAKPNLQELAHLRHTPESLQCRVPVRTLGMALGKPAMTVTNQTGASTREICSESLECVTR